MKRILRTLFKIGVSSGLLIWLLFKIDVDQILLRWQDTNWKFLILISPILFLVCIIVNVLRWKLILKQQGINIPFWNLVVIYIKGTFLGSFLPGGMATGDIYRMYSLAKNIGTKTVSISSVLMDRAMGVFSLLILSLFALYYSIFIINNEVFMPIAKVVLFITILFFMAGAFSITFIKKGYFNKINCSNSIILKLQHFIVEIPNYFSNKMILGKVFLLSLLFQFTIVFWTYVVSQALIISVPFHVLCVGVPLINFFALLPISIGGLGVRETAYVFFLVPFGLEASEAVSISLISVLLQTILRLLSGSVFFLRVNKMFPEN